MGWDTCEAWKSKADVLKAEVYDGRFGEGSRPMYVRKVRGGAWVLWEYRTPQVARFIELLLIERQGGVYGVKSLTAESGPYRYDCPVEWLNIPGVAFNTEWGMGVRAGAATAKILKGIPRLPRS